MVDVRFKDMDPDTGYISQDKLMATCMNSGLATLIKNCLEKEYSEEGNPNRDFYTTDSPEALGTYEQRIGWFVQNYYETGMEYEDMLENLRNVNLDAIQTVKGIISIPKLAKDLAPVIS